MAANLEAYPMSLVAHEQPKRSRLAAVLAFLRDESGQAMTEYSTISFALLLGSAGAAWPFMKDMLNAYRTYYDSIYFVLNLPFP